MPGRAATTAYHDPVAIPNRRADRTRLNKAALAAVVAGSVVGGVLGVFASWPGRAGIIVAIAAAWVVLMLSRRELAEARLHSHEQLMHATQRAYESLVAERATNDRVVTLLRERNSTVTASLVEMRGELLVRQAELAERRSEVSQLRGDNQSLRIDVQALVDRVDSLSGQIDAMEAVVEGEGAEVLSLPRRPMKHQRMLWSDDDVWGDDEMPSVVDLVRADMATPAADALRQA